MTGCDESFSPVDPSDFRFSIFGVLDAAADTQWIRISPLRPVLVTTPDPLDAVVTLEEVASGRIVELRDSVFRFSGNPDVGADGVFLHNFWTDEPIEPGASYRFRVQPPGDPASEALVQIPEEYETEVWLGQSRGDLLHLVGLEHVAFATVTHFHDGCGAAVEHNILDTFSSSRREMSIPIAKRVRSRPSCGAPEVTDRQIQVIGSGVPWPSGIEYSTHALGVTDIPSTISNSVGFLGGVLVRMIPYENCDIVSEVWDRDPYCALRYDERSATLRGTVMDISCEEPAGGVRVTLLEVDPDTPTSRKARWTISGSSGGFEIGALEEGRRYAVSARKLDRELRDIYREYADTLEFSAGETRTYRIGLVPLNACGAM